MSIFPPPQWGGIGRGMGKTSLSLIISGLFILLCGNVYADGPKIVSTPECVVFYAIEGESSPAAQNFKLSNGGTGTLQYSLSESTSWFSLDKSAGTITTNPDTINIRVDSAGLSEVQSPYIGDIIVTDTNNPSEPKTIKVRLSIISPESYAKAYSYDQNGNLVRRVSPSGDIIEYEYNNLNRLAAIYYPDGSTVTYSYNVNGNRVRMTDRTGTTSFVYDPFNRLAAVYFPNIEPVVYEYDKSGNITQITYPDHSTMDYTYNPDNKLVSVIDPTGTTGYTYYTDTGLLHTKALPNNVVTTYHYDSAKRITDVDNRGPGNALISAYHYEYDANSNITECQETTPSGPKTTSYTYDKLNRLKTVTYPDERGLVTYEYDAAGNRTKMITPQGTTNYKYDADNRLLKAGREIFFYDKAGNMTKRISPSKTSTYRYDYDNRLIEYQDNTYTVSFEYDGDGRRVAKTVNGRMTRYVNDILRNPYQVILEADADWRRTKVYRYGLDRLSQEEF